MYIDPILFTLGIASVSDAIRESRHTTHSTTSSTIRTKAPKVPKIDEKRLAEEIILAQERKKLQDAKFDREYEKSLDYYCIRYGRDVYDTSEEMKQLKLALRKSKPSCLYHTDNSYKIRIYRPDNNCRECYIKIGEDIVSAYILQLYMYYFMPHFGFTATDCHREIINNEIYFIIKSDFLRQLGWIQ